MVGLEINLEFDLGFRTKTSPKACPKCFRQQVRHLFKGNNPSVFFIIVLYNIVLLIKHLGAHFGLIVLHGCKVWDIKQDKEVEGKTDKKSKKKADRDEQGNTMHMPSRPDFNSGVSHISEQQARF